jgi:hypothetical protein
MKQHVFEIAADHDVASACEPVTVGQTQHLDRAGTRGEIDIGALSRRRRELEAQSEAGAVPRGSEDDARERAARRMARRLALKASSGMWKDDAGQAGDGLVFQKAMRAEWP